MKMIRCRLQAVLPRRDHPRQLPGTSRVADPSPRNQCNAIASGSGRIEREQQHAAMHRKANKARPVSRREAKDG